MCLFSHCKSKDQLGTCGTTVEKHNIQTLECTYVCIYLHTSHKRGFAYMVLFHVAIVNHFISNSTGLLRTQRLSVTKADRGFS